MDTWRLDRAEHARLMRHVDTTSSPDGCWLWTGPTMPSGYGKHRPHRGGPERAVHRVIWALHNAQDVPDGLELDHLCHSRAVAAETCPGGDSCPHRRCCNPAHLEPVTASVNTDRQAHSNRAKTHCPHGHPYTPENTAHRNGRRFCRTCART